MAIATGMHHLILTAWSAEQVPGLVLWHLDALPELCYEVVDFRDCNTCADVFNLLSRLPRHPDLRLPHRPDRDDLLLWHGGKVCQGNELIPFQCGTFLSVTETNHDHPVSCRIDEADLHDPPRFDIGIDDPVVQPADVQGRDDAIAVIRDDDNLIVAALNAHADHGSIHIIMYGYDGEAMGRRDTDVIPATFEALQTAIETLWNDYEGHLLKTYLVQPQPANLAREGLVFVVALQHVFAGTPVPADNHILCLAGIQLTYAGSSEPDIFRAFAPDETFDTAQIQRRLQLDGLCQPRGRRQCQVLRGSRTLTRTEQTTGWHGSYIEVHIGTEQAIFDIHRACSAVDSIIEDLEVARRDPAIQQIRLIQFGHLVLLGKSTKSGIRLRSSIVSAWLKILPKDGMANRLTG